MWLQYSRGRPGRRAMGYSLAHQAQARCVGRGWVMIGICWLYSRGVTQPPGGGVGGGSARGGRCRVVGVSVRCESSVTKPRRHWCGLRHRRFATTRASGLRVTSQTIRNELNHGWWGRARSTESLLGCWARASRRSSRRRAASSCPHRRAIAERSNLPQLRGYSVRRHRRSPLRSVESMSARPIDTRPRPQSRRH